MSLLTEGLQLKYSPPRVRVTKYKLKMPRTELYYLLHDNIQRSEEVFHHRLIPYDKEGRRSERAFSCLDLTKGNKIRLQSDHNSQVK